jgi:hypothetical protein
MMFKMDVVVEGIIALEPGLLESSSSSSSFSSSSYQTQKSKKYRVCPFSTYLHIGEEEMR